MKPLLAPKSMRALLFVQTLNEQGVFPSETGVKAFVDASPNFIDFDPYLDGLYPRIVQFLIDAMLLISTKRGVIITEAGRAILRTDSTPTSESGPLEVVGRMSDPFTYAQLLSRIDDVPEALVIDAYLPPQDLAAILKLTSVKRVLTRNIGAAGMNKADRDQKLRIALGARTDVELRFIQTGSTELHDRLVLPRGPGEALNFGTSTGGTQLTVITRFNQATTMALQLHYEGLWAASTPVEAIGREAPNVPDIDDAPSQPAS